MARRRRLGEAAVAGRAILGRALDRWRARSASRLVSPTRVVASSSTTPARTAAAAGARMRVRGSRAKMRKLYASKRGIQEHPDGWPRVLGVADLADAESHFSHTSLPRSIGPPHFRSRSAAARRFLDVAKPCVCPSVHFGTPLSYKGVSSRGQPRRLSQSNLLGGRAAQRAL